MTSMDRPLKLEVLDGFTNSYSVTHSIDRSLCIRMLLASMSRMIGGRVRDNYPAELSPKVDGSKGTNGRAKK